MSFLNAFAGFFKKLILFILILAITIPLRYKSTNVRYLRTRLLHSALSMRHSVLSDETRSELSADYLALESILRMRPKAMFNPTADPITIITELRSASSLGDAVLKPSNCQVNKEISEYDGHSVDTYWINYSEKKFQKDSDKLLIYFHGGGYALGNVQGKLYSLFEHHTY